MENPIFFSVIIPVHNKLPHLDRSIKSVLNQRYQNFELILIDDASTDGSEVKVLSYKDPRIKLLRRTKPGPGGYAARNLGIHNASYDWICFLDADDEWNINLLHTLEQTVRRRQELECVTWGWKSVQDGQKWTDGTTKLNRRYDFRYFTLIDFFNRRHTVWTGAVAFKKDLLLRAGLFPEVSYKRGGDVDTWIRCLWHSKANFWINRSLSLYYLDSVNMVTKTVKMDPSYIFAPFVLQLLNGSNDPKLVKAIRAYQNERIFSTARRQIIDAQPVDLSLLREMNISGKYFILMARLLFNKIRYNIISLLKASKKREEECESHKKRHIPTGMHLHSTQI